MIPALIGKVKDSQAKQKAKELLDMLGLADRLGHKPNELSGGEKATCCCSTCLN
jgi:ABC-type antimicrobial peptide transport system, ATPase component